MGWLFIPKPDEKTNMLISYLEHKAKKGDETAKQVLKEYEEFVRRHKAKEGKRAQQRFDEYSNWLW